MKKNIQLFKICPNEIEARCISVFWTLGLWNCPNRSPVDGRLTASAAIIRSLTYTITFRKHLYVCMPMTPYIIFFVSSLLFLLQCMITRYIVQNRKVNNLKIHLSLYSEQQLTYVVFPQPVGPRIAFIPGGNIPLKVNTLNLSNREDKTYFSVYLYIWWWMKSKEKSEKHFVPSSISQG